MLNKNQQLNWVWEPLYDSCIINPGAGGISEFAFFRSCLGMVGHGFNRPKNKTDTNLLSANELGYPRQFLLYGFAFSIVGNISTNDKESIKSGVFRFVRATENPFIEFEQLMHIIPINPWEDNAFTSLSKNIKYKNGEICQFPFNTPFYYFKMGDPFLIDNATNFECKILYPQRLKFSGITRDKIKLICFMVGEMGKSC